MGRGGATGTGGLGEQSPSTPHKDHFCKWTKSDEKNWGYGGVTSSTKFKF